MSGEAQQKPAKSAIHKWIEKMAVHLHNEENKRLVQLYVVDPILNHVMDRVFPYIILTCALFSLLVILVGLTFVILLMKVSPAAVATTVATATAAPIPLNLPISG
jgi:hypothetical protein